MDILHICLMCVISCIIHPTIAAGNQLYATKHGQRSTGQVPLKSIAVSSITKCQVLCQTTGNCTASNFGPINSAENGEHTCELLNADSFIEDTLEHSHGWIYLEKHNACTKSPCSQGTCHVIEGGFNCTCAEGFEGRTCNENVDECASSPCVNGECFDGINGFACTCEDAYEGTLCDEVSPCPESHELISSLADDALTASSRPDGWHGAAGSKMNMLTGGWRPLTDDSEKWIQVDLGVHSRVNAILTKGEPVGFVTRYNLAISNNGTTWSTLKSSGGFDIQFVGNIDFLYVARNDLPETIFARYIRLVIVDYDSYPILKWELEGCN